MSRYRSSSVLAVAVAFIAAAVVTAMFGLSSSYAQNQPTTPAIRAKQIAPAQAAKKAEQSNRQLRMQVHAQCGFFLKQGTRSPTRLG